VTPPQRLTVPPVPAKPFQGRPLEDGMPVAVLRFTVVDGRITAIDALGGPARIARLHLGGVLGP
jgi:hypothetical protein